MVEVALRAVRVDLQSRTPVLVLQETGRAASLDPDLHRRARGRRDRVRRARRARAAAAHPRPAEGRDHRARRDASRASSSPSCATPPTTPSSTSDRRAGTSIVSARPSDAVALALRTESPLFVDDELMDEEGRMIELADEDDEESTSVDGDVDELAEQFRDFLDTVHPEDFQP